jgi:pimeloyl-ACP methyl ester carboxylesterase
MAAISYVPSYRNVSVAPEGLGTFNINYIEAGSSSAPTILLLHGFPSSSTQYRDLIPMLSGKYHVLAPDFPAYGLTESPSGLAITFDNIAAAISAWLVALNIVNYAMYVFDYGAPVGWRLALEKPEQVKAVISQNGNAYEAGFGDDFWAPAYKLWENNSDSNRQYLLDNLINAPGTKMQYYLGPEKDWHLVNPVQWHTDFWMNIQGKENQQRQLDLFYDYRTYKDLYPKVHKWFRESQIPLLAVWGKHDIIFIPPGAEAFKKDLPNAEVHLVDAGHFALETKRWEIADYMLKFLSKNGYC